MSYIKKGMLPTRKKAALAGAIEGAQWVEQTVLAHQTAKGFLWSLFDASKSAIGWRTPSQPSNPKSGYWEAQAKAAQAAKGVQK